jgi:hypothetical protein
MKQFLVPQFSDVEPKILGPLTVKNFIVIIIGVLLCVLAWKFADITLFILEALVIVVITALVGFVKINSRPFYLFLVDLLNFSKKGKIRVWNKDYDKIKVIEEEEEKKEEKKQIKISVTGSKLNELSLLLDTGGAYKIDDENLN